MKFKVEGSKAWASNGYITEVDLLTLPKINIRARQRLLTNLSVSSWQNTTKTSEDGKRYQSAIITLRYVFLN
jgi:hypothetical protein